MEEIDESLFFLFFLLLLPVTFSLARVYLPINLCKHLTIFGGQEDKTKKIRGVNELDDKKWTKTHDGKKWTKHRIKSSGRREEGEGKKAKIRER